MIIFNSISLQSLNSKQRQLRKSGNNLTETDAAELLRISNEQSILQKHLDQSRKQTRQHGMLIQEYNSKQQQQQRQPSTPQVPQSNNPESCSPLMSPSQQSPMHSPAALVSQSPGPSMIQHSPATPSIVQHSPGTPLLQHSPGNPQSTNPNTMSPHNVQQQSPRIGTPHSQGGEESPFSPQSNALPSSGGLCGANAVAARMTSPQHRALISNRGGTFAGTDAGRGQPQQQQRFVRPASGGGAIVNEAAAQQRVPPRGVGAAMPVYGQRSPLGSPQPTVQQTGLLSQQPQLLQKQQMIQQQQHDAIPQEGQNIVVQRTLQMTQQRQQILQQQHDVISQDRQSSINQRSMQMVQQQRQQILQQHEVISQDGQSIAAQRSLQMAQQRQQIIQQQQHEGISQDGQSIVTQRALQMTQQRQQIIQQHQQQQQQQHDNVSQDGQNIVSQRTLQMTQQRQQILQQQQHEAISQTISQEGQNVVAQRSLQIVQQRQQILQQQQHDVISQEGQNAVTQRTLQMTQRQQLLQQQQHENFSQIISQEGQSAINQRSLQIVQQRQQMLQQQQQQRQQYLQMQQQQQQKPPSSPMVSQPANSPSPQLHQQLQQGYGQPPSSPMVQQTAMSSPMLQQQLNPTSQPPSPMNRISPMVSSQYQPPSPMSRSHPSTSPMLHSHHPSSANQPPSSPMMPRSPLIASSPMQMQRRQSTGNSPAMPDRPQSVENPPTPRTPHTPHNFVQQNTNLPTPGDQQQQILQQIPQPISQEQVSSSEHTIRGGGNPHNLLNPAPSPHSTRGGGNPKNPLSPVPSSALIRGGGNFRNPLNPIPFPNFGRFGYFKLGLRGGSPMWSSKGAESSKSSGANPGSDTSQEEKPNTSMYRKPTKISSLVCVDYNDFDDDSHTPPQTPPTNLEAKQGNQSSSLNSSTLENGPLPLESPGEKLEQLPDTTDYDDDKTIVNTEVTLSSAAQRDSDDITVIEHFGDSELVDVISGSLESDMQEEYVLFEPGMVVDLSTDSNDSLCHALVNADTSQGDLVQILEIENAETQVEEPILSDDDLADTRNKKSLRLDIVRTLQSGKKLVAVTDTPESPDQEELRVDPSPGPYLDNSPDQDLVVSLVSESEVVIIDPTTKSPEDNLSKGSCDDDTEKTDGTNILIDASRDDTITEGLIDDQIKSSQKDSKQNKSPTNFVFSEKNSYNQNTPSIAQEAAIINVVTTSKSLISSAPTTGSSSSITILTSTNSYPQVSAQATTAESKAVNQGTSLNSFGNQKSVNLPLTMASIVADAKLAARLSQTVLENISNIQQSKPDLKIPSETPKSSSLATTSSIQNEFFSLPNVVETSSKPTKLILSVQPTSVTLSTPKMSIPDLKKDNTLKTKEKQAEENDIKRKKEEEELVQAKIRNQGVSSTVSSALITEEKKNDPLNTTDELESMLEAIHNPAETVLKNESKSEAITTATLKRISPVTDDLSLVNILENDAEPVENDKEENSSNSETQKAVNKSKEIESEVKETNNVKDTSSKEKTAEELELENAKPYLQHCLNEEKALMEESSDDILDMLHNIISSKPEMANSGEMKPSLIYQMPTPLDTLPLNILQDSLMDLEQENLENDQLSSSDNKNQAKSQNFEAKKSPSAPNQTVAQLQKNTTTVPHLSPLSKPTELTSNVANVSHQLRTLLSSLQSNQTTGNQTGVVTIVCSVKTGSVLSTTSTLSTLNSSTSNVSTLSRPDQSRLQTNLSTNVAKEPGLTLKEAAKDPVGITSATSKVSIIL